MSGPSRRFDPAELNDLEGTPLTDAEQAAMLSTARDLETFARAESITPSAGFEDRVMAAVAAEAPPRPVATGGWLAGMVMMVRDSWRIAFSSGRPMAVRAQALALVLLVVVALGSVGTLATVGVARLLSDGPTPPPTIDPSPAPSLVAPSPSDVPTVSPSVVPSPSVSPSPSPTATEAAETDEPSETPEGTDDEGSSGATARPSATSTDAPSTPKPTKSPEPTDDDDDDDEGTPEPEDTPEPTDDDDDEETPEPTDD